MKMNLIEAKEILNKNGYLIENRHFDLWQYKLLVKKLLKPLYGNVWKNFDALRSEIEWELSIDIVKETMKNAFENGKTAEECVEEIKDLANTAYKIGG